MSTDIHKLAKQRWLEQTNQYEHCGVVWPNGSPCLGRACTIQAELDRVKKASPVLVRDCEI